MTLFAEWLAETRKLQTEVYGVDYSRFQDDRELIDYIKINFIASIAEHVEMLDETTWKPWARDEPHVARNLVMKEVVDILHFVGNILAACDITDDQLSSAYETKMQQNRARQQRDGGYRVRGVDADKCVVCSRALDDVGTSSTQAGVCSVCVP